MTVTDRSTNVSKVEVTAQVSSDIHPSRVKPGDIASCILTDIIFSLHVAEDHVTAGCILTYKNCLRRIADPDNNYTA